MAVEKYTQVDDTLGATADFVAGGKVVASYIKGDAGNKREFRCTRKVTGS